MAQEQDMKRTRKKHNGATSVFEGGNTAAEGTASEARVDLLYPHIVQVKVGNAFLARKLGK
jgi:hypothetical protein